VKVVFPIVSCASMAGVAVAALPCQATAASPVPTSCAAAPRDWGRPSTTGSPPSRVSGGRASAPPWLGTDRRWNSARILTARPHVGPARGGVAQMLQMLNLNVADVIFPCCNLRIWMFHRGDWAAPGRRPPACLGSSLCPPPPAVGHRTPAKLCSDAHGVGHAWGAIAQMLRTLDLDVADVIFPWCNLIVWMFHHVIDVATAKMESCKVFAI
jgi:hypothetical protein